MRMFSLDTLYNLVSAMGTTKDKVTHSQYLVNELTQQQLEAAFRGDWVARKAVVIPAKDATRAWRSWQASDQQIEKIEAEEVRLGLQRKLYKAMVKARLYGGAALLMGIGDEAPDLPLDPEKVTQGGLRYLHALSRYELGTSGQLDRDVNSPYFGRPTHYVLRSAGLANEVKVHPSRVIPFLGNEVLDATTGSASANEGWGDSVLQAVDDAIKNVGLTSQGIAQLVHESKIDIIKMPGLMADVTTSEYRSRVLDRFQLANVAKSTVNTLLLDKDEEWQRINANFSTLPDILKVYLLIASGAVDIPATRFIGQSAVGLGATGEGDARNYYDSVNSDQNNELTPALAPLDDVLIRSATGGRDASIYFTWNSLWQVDPKVRADTDYVRAQTFKIDVDAGLEDPEVLKVARRNQLIEDGTYPGIESAIDENGGTEGELDENNAEVQAQFTQTKEGAPAPAEPQKQALNGGQITSLTEVIAQVVGEKMPPESAKALIAVSFPSLGPDDINKLIDPLANFEKPAPVVPPGLTPNLPGQKPEDAPPPAKPDNDNRLGPDGKPLALTGDSSRPRTLYMRRDLVNVAEVMAWAKDQGFEEPIKDLHVTVIYSKAAFDWMRVSGDPGWGEDAKGQLVIPAGGARVVEPIGDEGAVALLFNSSSLAWRHREVVEAGASHDYDDYQPHMTISYRDGQLDLRGVEPYRGKLVLGPEVWQELEQ